MTVHTTITPATATPSGARITYEIACKWAKKIPVFPIHANSKIPVPRTGFKESSQDASVLALWVWEGRNIAASPEDAGRCVIDLDGPEGEKSWAQLQMIYGEAPKTFTVRTPSGGYHLWFRGSLPPSVSKLGKNIDTRGRGSYVLLPPSSIAGIFYESVGLSWDEMADLPEWVAPLLATGAVATAGPDDIELDLPVNVQKAREHLKNKPIAVEGTRDNDAYQTACWLYDHALSHDMVFQLMNEFWLSSPKFPESELAVKVTSAEKTRQNSGAPHASRPPAEEYAHLLKGNQPVLERRDSSRMDLISADEAEGLPEPSYIVDGIIPDRSLVSIYGRSGSFKSFTVLELLLATATGMKAFGKYETKQAPAVLCVGEAVHGTARKRLPVWRAAHSQQSSLPFYLVRGVPIMGTADIDTLAQKIREKGIRPGLIAIDTVARSLGAMDENAAASMNLLVAASERLIHEFNCTVILIHHSGKDDTKGARGSSALHAAVDAEFRVQRGEGSLLVELACTKMKDDDEPEPILLQGKPFGSSLIFDAIEQENVEAAKREAKSGITDETAFINECARLAIEAAETGLPFNRQARVGDWVLEKLKDAGFGSVTNPQVKNALKTATHRRLLRFEKGGNRRAAGYYPWHEEIAADLAIRAKNLTKKEGE